MLKPPVFFSTQGKRKDIDVKLETIRKINDLLDRITELERQRAALDNEQDGIEAMRESLDTSIADLEAERLELLDT